MGRNEIVRVLHNGIKRDDAGDGAVLFYVDGDEDEAWVPRSLLKSYDDEEFWTPLWKAEDLGCDYE